MHRYTLMTLNGPVSVDAETPEAARAKVFKKPDDARMTAADYRAALATLGLSQLAAGRWLGVSNKTAQRYATTGPSGAAARAVTQALIIRQAYADLCTGDIMSAVTDARFALELALNEIDCQRK